MCDDNRSNRKNVFTARCVVVVVAVVGVFHLISKAFFLQFRSFCFVPFSDSVFIYSFSARGLYIHIVIVNLRCSRPIHIFSFVSLLCSRAITTIYFVE